MKSIGKNRGYRCKPCGTKTMVANFRKMDRKNIGEGLFYEPPVSAKRHLSKPLKRERMGLNF